MNKGIFAVLGFLIGGAVGILTTKECFKKKYSAIADEEIESVKTAWEKRSKRKPEKKEVVEARMKAEKAKTKPNIVSYSQHTDKLGYSSAFKKEEPKSNGPKVISTDVYYDDDEHEKITLTYYKGDGIMTDDRDEIMDETSIENSVGSDAINHFGEYEPDAVYVLNDSMDCMYEILLDERSYSSTASGKSVVTED